jgi:hypothetical protein
MGEDSSLMVISALASFSQNSAWWINTGSLGEQTSKSVAVLGLRLVVGVAFV